MSSDADSLTLELKPDLAAAESRWLAENTTGSECQGEDRT
jgi:hypothetical protein